MAFDVGGGKGRVRPAINVTPLVDVVLVLLIIFMVVTPLLSKHFWLQVPVKDDADRQPPPPSDDVEPPVVLSITKEGTIRLNSDAVEEAGLPEKIARVLAAREDNVVFFTADAEVPFGRTMELLDLARAGGASPISVLTDPMEL